MIPSWSREVPYQIVGSCGSYVFGNGRFSFGFLLSSVGSAGPCLGLLRTDENSNSKRAIGYIKTVCARSFNGVSSPVLSAVAVFSVLRESIRIDAAGLMVSLWTMFSILTESVAWLGDNCRFCAFRQVTKINADKNVAMIFIMMDLENSGLCVFINTQAKLQRLF